MSDLKDFVCLTSHCKCNSRCDDCSECERVIDNWLEAHDKQIRDEVMIDTLNSVLKMIDDWGYEDLTSVVLRENLKARIEQMKGGAE